MKAGHDLSDEFLEPDRRHTDQRAFDVIDHGHELVEIGAYVAGADRDADRALANMDQIDAFLRQPMDESTPLGETWARLHELVVA